ncbi:MAG: hypothetical protein PHT94_04105 [Candidatus Nanoarchaeia archaeon]|nr:hypothetical protein [Candidatus Nanoarchaeia archaeon]
MKKSLFFLLFFFLILPLGYSYLSVQSDISSLYVCSYQQFNLRVENLANTGNYDFTIQSENPFINFRSPRYELKSQESYKLPVKLNVGCGLFEGVDKINLTLSFHNYNTNKKETYIIETKLLKQDIIEINKEELSSDEKYYFINYNIKNNNTFREKFTIEFIFQGLNINSSELLSQYSLKQIEAIKHLLKNSKDDLITQINSSQKTKTISFSYNDLLIDEYILSDEFLINSNETITIKNQINKEDLLLLNSLNITYFIKIKSNNYGDEVLLNLYSLDKDIVNKLNILSKQTNITLNTSNAHNFLFNNKISILLNERIKSSIRSINLLENNNTIKKYNLFKPKSYIDLNKNQSLEIVYKGNINDLIFTTYLLKNNNLEINEYNINVLVPKKQTYKYFLYQLFFRIILVLILIALILLIIKYKEEIKSKYKKVKQKIKEKSTENSLKRKENSLKKKEKNKLKKAKKVEEKVNKIKNKIQFKNFLKRKSKKDVLEINDNTNFILEEKVRRRLEEDLSNSKLDDNIKKESIFKKLKNFFKKIFKSIGNFFKKAFRVFKKIFWILLLILIILLVIYLYFDYNSFNNSNVVNYSNNESVDSLKDFFYYAQNLSTYFRNDTFFTNNAFLTLLYGKTSLIEDKLMIGDDLRFDKDKYFSDPDNEVLSMIFEIDYFIPLSESYSRKISLDGLEIKEEDSFFKESQEGLYKLRAKVYDKNNESAISEYFYYFNYKSKQRYDFFSYLAFKYNSFFN